MTAPTGSASAAISSSDCAMPAMRAPSSVPRSIIAALAPDARIARTSSALAARISCCSPAQLFRGLAERHVLGFGRGHCEPGRSGARAAADVEHQGLDRRRPRLPKTRCAWRSCVPQHHVVPVDHLGAAPIAEQRLDFARLRLPTILFASSRSKAMRPRPISAPCPSQDDHRVAARKGARHGGHAGGQQALAGSERRRRPGIDGDRAARLQMAGDPGLSALGRRRLRGEPGGARAGIDRRERILACGRWRSPSTRRRRLRSSGLDLRLHAAARQLRAGRAGHRLDRRRDRRARNR